MNAPMILSWCPKNDSGGPLELDPNDPCHPCKPKPPSSVPPPASGGSWPPPPGSAVLMWVYAMQDHLTNNVPDGGLVLDGIGGQWIGSQGVGSFTWNWGPTPINDPSWGAMYFVSFLDYMDHAGPRAIGTGVPGETAKYSTLPEAQANAQIFQTYFYG